MFGRLTKGMDVVNSIEAVSVDDTDKSLNDVLIAYSQYRRSLRQ